MSVMPVETLSQFFEICRSTIPDRRTLTADTLDGRRPDPTAVAHLRDVLDALVAIPQEAAGRRLRIDDHHDTHVDLTYEIDELHKDLLFLEHGEDALHDDLTQRHHGFADEVEAGIDALAGRSYRAFVTDRDGTVNNYCGRYASSVQSVYNAVYLTRFARVGADTSITLTAAPLDGIGLADLSVHPAGEIVTAGSKGREYFDRTGRRHRYPIDAEQQRQLDLLNDGLTRLVSRPEHEVFTLIGSGLQQKFGQTTIARQDITRSVPTDRSDRFLEQIGELVRSIDPDGACFRIEDTGLDVEVLLTVDSDDGATRDFDKGDGVHFLDDDLQLGMSQGPCLVCGDTGSDVPMLAAALEMAPETQSVFVTRDEGLRARVHALLPSAVFVTEPDALVTILHRLSRT